MRIHKEGSTILLTLATALVVIYLGALYVSPEKSIIPNLVLGVELILFVMVLQFFRVPSRKLTHNDNYVIAPADGKVVSIEEVYEPEYLKDNRKLVSIFMSPVNVHVNRHPISGKVIFQKYHPGLFLVAWHPKSSTENERTTIVVEHKTTRRVLIRQIAGAVARRIIYYTKVDELVKQNTELGFIKFGSRVDLFLPLDTEINVEIGQKVKGGVTLVAELVPRV